MFSNKDYSGAKRFYQSIIYDYKKDEYNRNAIKRLDSINKLTVKPVKKQAVKKNNKSNTKKTVKNPAVKGQSKSGAKQPVKNAVKQKSSASQPSAQKK